MKRSKQCPKCASVRIGYIPEQPDANFTTNTSPRVLREELTTGRAVGHSAETIDEGFMSSGLVRALVGVLEAYVCTDCGFHETYVKDPTTMPWTGLRGFAWVNPDRDPDGGPFR